MLPAGVGSPRGLSEGSVGDAHSSSVPTAGTPSSSRCPHPGGGAGRLLGAHRAGSDGIPPPLPVAGKTPEDVVRRYIQKVKNPPDEVSGEARAPRLSPWAHSGAQAWRSAQSRE